MNNVYRTIAEGYEKLAAGYRALAEKGEKPDIPPAPPEVEKPLTIEEVRAVLSRKSDEGKTAQVKALLMKYDAGKLSGVDSAKYAALVKEAEAL